MRIYLRWITGGLTVLLILGMVGGILLAQEEEVYSPEEEAAYSPEEIIPVVEPPVPVPAKPTNAIQNIEVVDLPEKVRIVIHTTQPAEYIIGKLYKPKMLYIDILNSVNDLSRRSFRVKKGPVKRIRSSQYQVLPIEISRIVVDLEKWVKHEIAREETKLYLEFYKPEVLIAKAPPEEKAPPAEKPEKEEEVSPEEEEKALSEERLISLSFTDAPMSAVLNFLAEMSGYNIVASAEVIEGTVTINLKDVPVMTALDTILKTKDLWYTTDKNIITVMTMSGFLESIKARAELTKIYRLQYAIAADLAATLNNVLGGAVQKTLPKGIRTTWVSAGAEEAIEAFKTISFKGKTFVIFEERTNSLIVTTDDPANFLMLEALIKQLDTPTLQVMIETQIAEVKLTDDFKFGITWLWRKMGIEPAIDARGMMRFDNAEQMLSDVDMEVMGTRRMYDASTGEWTDISLTETTMTWDKNAEAWVYTVEGTSWPMKMVTPLTSDSVAGYKFLILNRHLDMLLQMTKTVSDIDIISNPKIVTANHIKGHIFIGEKIPIVFGAGSGKWTWRWEEVGVTLDVTPHINERGETTLEVKTHVSELGDYRTVFNVPSVITRTVDTKVVVPDGQTLVIGGMMRNTIKEGRTGIPGLMSIPLLKYLFSTRTKQKEKMEYLFFLTPRIIKAGREIRPEEIPEMPAASILLESSPPAEVSEIEPIKEKERSKKQKKKKSKR